MFGFGSLLGGTDEAMAKNKEANTEIVNQFAERLSASGCDQRNFDAVLCELKSSAAVRKIEAVEIACRYIGSSRKPESKKAAIEVIVKRFVEKARMRSKLVIAEKERLI
jgi:hypothetical protein